MFKKITEEIVLELLRQRITLTHVFFLDKINQQQGFQVPDSIQQLLERKLLVANQKITPQGIEFLEYIIKGKKPKKASLSSGSLDFDRWWDIFPSTNNFEYKGRVFEGSRTMKMKKPECRVHFNKYIATGEFTAEQIINGTIVHIELAKKESFTKGDNKLSFLMNSERYLREKSFQPFINIKQESNTSEFCI